MRTVRHWIQLLAALITNAYLPGFRSLTLYQGVSKQVCVPVLNCYSCPGAVFSCPVGAMQTLLGSFSHRISLYVGGLLTLVGAAGGRFACGWFCPFGLLQDLLKKLHRKAWHLAGPLTLFKYVVLAGTLLLPVLWLQPGGYGWPVFCKFLCPAGTIEAGLPLGLGRPEFRGLLGLLFSWKVFVLITVMLGSIFYYRPFCRVLCPLGAFYGLFNRISLWRLERNDHTCTGCGRCEAVCPMEVPVQTEPNGGDCIRCLVCRDECPSGALSFGYARTIPAADLPSN